MAEFEGRMWAEFHPSDAANGTLEVSDDRITARIAGAPVGDWWRGAVTVDQQGDRFRLSAAGETLVFEPADPAVRRDLAQALISPQPALAPAMIASSALQPTRAGTVALVLGIVGSGLAMTMLVFVMAAVLGVSMLAPALASLVASVGEGGAQVTDPASGVSLEVDRCDPRGVAGTIHNSNRFPVDVALEIVIYDMSGAFLGSTSNLVSGIATGTARFDGEVGGPPGWQSCSVFIAGADRSS